MCYQVVKHDFLVTPYSTLTLFLANKTAAVLWYHNMISGPAGQNQYGSTEGVSVFGESVSPFVTWDSKMTTVLGMMGGVQEYTAKKMVADGYLRLFQNILSREWGRVFTTIKGVDAPFAYPNKTFDKKRPDFTSCSVKSSFLE